MWLILGGVGIVERNNHCKCWLQYRKDALSGMFFTNSTSVNPASFMMGRCVPGLSVLFP
jgi:hypothetical protein